MPHSVDCSSLNGEEPRTPRPARRALRLRQQLTDISGSRLHDLGSQSPDYAQSLNRITPHAYVHAQSLKLITPRLVATTSQVLYSAACASPWPMTIIQTRPEALCS
ncbi:hypothetical protein DPSP01_002290 [Paraphaeosphaeria sporulosa]